MKSTITASVNVPVVGTTVCYTTAAGQEKQYTVTAHGVVLTNSNGDPFVPPADRIPAGAKPGDTVQYTTKAGKVKPMTVAEYAVFIRPVSGSGGAFGVGVSRVTVVGSQAAAPAPVLKSQAGTPLTVDAIAKSIIANGTVWTCAQMAERFGITVEQLQPTYNAAIATFDPLTRQLVGLDTPTPAAVEKTAPVPVVTKPAAAPAKPAAPKLVPSTEHDDRVRTMSALLEQLVAVQAALTALTIPGDMPNGTAYTTTHILAETAKHLSAAHNGVSVLVNATKRARDVAAAAPAPIKPAAPAPQTVNTPAPAVESKPPVATGPAPDVDVIGIALRALDTARGLSGLKKHRVLKAACTTLNLPNGGTVATLTERLNKAAVKTAITPAPKSADKPAAAAKSAPAPAVKPTVPTLFVQNADGSYRPATEAEVWAALDSMTRKAAA